MIKSMTGVGNGSASNDDFDVTVRMQSVNNRYLDINIRMSSAYNSFENDIRNHCRKFLSRGRIDVSLDIQDRREDAVDAQLNLPVVNAYLRAVENVAQSPGVEKLVRPAEILAFPQALKLDRKDIEDSESFRLLLIAVIDQAVKQLIESRSLEGRRLFNDISERLKICGELIADIEARAGEVKIEYHTRIKERVSELMDDVDLDEFRLEQEVAYLADRSDITEEIVRFKSHITGLEELFSFDGSIGKKLDFIVQEMNREVNTIGSKSKSVEISRSVIELKSEIEKIREQVQNVE